MDEPKQIVVLGGGFAGLWVAVGAARKLAESGIGPDQVQVTLVNRDAFHSIRVRNYEADLTNVRVPLDQVLAPIGVSRVEGDVRHIDVAAHSVEVEDVNGTRQLHYDWLVFALGSELARPPIPGLAEHAFDVDTFTAAEKLNDHIQQLPDRPDAPGRWTFVVIGAGLTGVEAALELPIKLRRLMQQTGKSWPWRIVLVDHSPVIGSQMGESARPVIEAALRQQQIEIRTSALVTEIGADHVQLGSGERIAAATVIWCGGMKANARTRDLGVALDTAGRIPVNEFLQVQGLPGVFAAGDSSVSLIDSVHPSVMSCQHSRPMGRFAGHNVACDLLGLPLFPLHIDWYATVLDLGDCGAVYTQGWDRKVVAQGDVAKQTKMIINQQRIYPPLTGNREEIFAAAAPIVQSAPK
ncbi:NAD(P)/FAD-dependent oxidoreductase [Planctomicrobium piriforme]|uniref:NADH dehydrogenase n=1 Tax=Planctomicrobium piriforme TaxID=1576369 RepID=A0A1I3D0H8_9PLAN|nr:FAD-dependent oxidoreductase [Planctomicrobium piriforme]SFH80039.1 NADH dehydrogenase [Planctomicrobium piriforme]